MLEVRGLGCVRGTRSLISDLSFTLGAGELLRVEGPNGCGKTTLLRTVCGLTRPERGAIFFRGAAAEDLGDEFRAAIDYHGHVSALKDELDPIENVVWSGRIAGMAVGTDAARAALRALGLAGRDHVPARHLSQGQRRRVSLARLALDPRRPLWVLDEPFTALDAAAVSRVCELIGEHLRAGGAALLTTHQEIEVDGHVQRRLRLGGG